MEEGQTQAPEKALLPLGLLALGCLLLKLFTKYCWVIPVRSRGRMASPGHLRLGAAMCLMWPMTGRGFDSLPSGLQQVIASLNLSRACLLSVPWPTVFHTMAAFSLVPEPPDDLQRTHSGTKEETFVVLSYQDLVTFRICCDWA